MHYLPFMAAITLFPLVGRGDEGSGGGGGGWRGNTAVGGSAGESHGAVEGWGWGLGGWGHVYNEDALSAVLYCTLSLIGAQIRASHYNHLRTGQRGQHGGHGCRAFNVAVAKKMEAQLSGSCACSTTASGRPHRIARASVLHVRFSTRDML